MSLLFFFHFIMSGRDTLNWFNVRLTLRFCHRLSVAVSCPFSNKQRLRRGPRLDHFSEDHSSNLNTSPEIVVKVEGCRVR